MRTDSSPTLCRGAKASSDGDEINALLKLLDHRPASRLDRHPADCCRIAEAWFLSMARAGADRFAHEPGWISNRWGWGPTRWPLAWCEAVERRELDCGALAALAEAAFEAAQVAVCRVQLLVKHDPERIDHWEARWGAHPEAPQWTWGLLAYHEVVGVLDSANLRLWDATRGRWLEGTLEGRIAALKLTASEDGRVEPCSIRWESLDLPLGRWILTGTSDQGG